MSVDQNYKQYNTVQCHVLFTNKQELESQQCSPGDTHSGMRAHPWLVLTYCHCHYLHTAMKLVQWASRANKLIILWLYIVYFGNLVNNLLVSFLVQHPSKKQSASHGQICGGDFSRFAFSQLLCLKTLRIKLAIWASHSVLAPGQPVLMLSWQASRRVIARVTAAVTVMGNDLGSPSLKPDA